MSPRPNEAVAEMVVTSVAQRWRDLGEDAMTVSWAEFVDDSPASHDQTQAEFDLVVVPKHWRAEIVLTSGSTWQSLVVVLREISARGWQVSVITRLADMGAAHDALHDLHVPIQGWWQREDSSLKFSPLEIA